MIKKFQDMIKQFFKYDKVIFKYTEEKMEQITKFIENIQVSQIIDILIAVGIIFVFRILSSELSYIIIRMFKFKTKSAKKIRESALYNPLKVFFIILGFYIAALFLRTPLGINEKIMGVITQIFRIITTMAIANGLAQSFNPKSTLVAQMKKKLNKDMEDAMLGFILKIVRGAIYVVAGFIVITELGFNLNGLVAGLGISGVIVTLAAQDTAKNLFGGVVIVMDKPFVVGDWIAVGKFEGTVEDITFRSTRVRTFENSLVNIPNSTIANESIINWSKMEKRRYKANLCLELDTPLEKVEVVKDRIRNVLLKHEQIEDDTIIVKFDSIDENGINVLVCSYTDSVDYTSYLTEKERINYKIMQILKEENVKLAYDTKTVFVKS